MGPALGALVPPRALVVSAPIVPGAQQSAPPYARQSPVPATKQNAGGSRDYRASLLAHNRIVSAQKFHSSH